jgi:hypothetical protein
LEIYRNSKDILDDAQSIITKAIEAAEKGILEDTELYNLLKPKQFISELEESKFLVTLNGNLSKLVSGI